jgi:polysaccharide biosynthesis transport protein
MTSAGAEALKAAFRRSLPIMIGLVLLGIVAVNVFKHLQGPRYQASSSVQISATPLSSIITGTQPAFVDPQRVQDTAQILAQSSQVYQLAARQNPGLGSGSSLHSATIVNAVPNTDILSFTVTSQDHGRATRTANAVANAYVAFRARLSRSSIMGTLAKLQATVNTLPVNSPQRIRVQQQINQLQLLGGATSTDAEVIEPATSATKTSPSLTKDSLLGFALGLVIALIVVAIREAVDTTVRSEADVEDLLSAPVLATVRTLPRATRIVTYGRHEAAFADTFALLAAQLAPDKPKGEGTVLAVTSALAREGKTTTAANLAIAAARRGTNVVLADFDFRKSALSHLFEIPQYAVGALQLLDDQTTLDIALWDVKLDGPRPTVAWSGKSPSPPVADGPVEQEFATNGSGDPNAGSLRLLPSGGVISAHELAKRPRLGNLLRELQAEAELIILDTPPALLTVEMTELAQLIDTVLVVVRQGRVSQRNLRSLGRHARSWPAAVAGAVLTDVPAGAGYASYYGGR